MQGKKKVSPKRYNLVLEPQIFKEITDIAERHHMKALELVKKYIRLGLVVSRLEETGEGELIMRKGKDERKVMMI